MKVLAFFLSVMVAIMFFGVLFKSEYFVRFADLLLPFFSFTILAYSVVSYLNFKKNGVDYKKTMIFAYLAVSLLFILLFRHLLRG
ncbi:hypothetical protein DES40_1206 [Litorimonas taeanensis]|uniref:Uncharacterized protein n=1 Tax=Litorimonas taeanensis TaxID=568099 RepID=A0A420WLH7_9PROT|nr:hypothetical protein DES40_1206 [Litorimonas taeanensis]